MQTNTQNNDASDASWPKMQEQDVTGRKLWNAA